MQKRREVVKQYRQLYTLLKSKSKAKQLSKKNGDEENNTELSKNTSVLDKIPRTSLLLSIPQMIREDYPLAFDSSQSHDMSKYVYTKDVYEPVSNSSPLYSIDCEMCYNVDGEMETVWLALVDESLECVYETYVQPRKKILNYLTGITGITQSTLQGVSVDLSDVQNKLREILPPDAILCGQSLNNDLHSLQVKF